MKYWFALLLLVGLTAPSHAAWHEAQSDNFVIYSNTRANDLEDFAMMLERYHKAMEQMTGRQIEKPSPSSRVTVFAVGSDSNLKNIYGDRSSNVAGFYIPRASGSVAFVPNIKIRNQQSDFSLTVLLHEYAHHFLISSSAHAMPRWLSEGSAEFFAAARFPSDGSVQIGLPNNHRAYEISQADEVSVRELLDYELYSANRGGRYDAYYGRSWLLYHYLHFSDERKGQLANYWRAVTGGMPSMEAAELVLGDLDRLERELKSYSRLKRLPGWSFSAEEIPIGTVSVRKLSDGMDKMMPVMIRSKRGVNGEEATELVEKARDIAADFPADAGVLAALAEAEYDAGNDAQAIAAANRALEINPATKDALVQKGLALFRVAEDADDQDAAYATAMGPFGKLNALENDHTLPLIYYYRSFANRGKAPPEGARHALERASQLAMFDQSLMMNVALMQAAEGKISIARYTLGPLAANPHGGSRSRAATALIQAMADATEGEPFNATAYLREDTE